MAELAAYFNEHPGPTLDVGQVVFGDTTSMTADGAVGQYLHRVTGRRWVAGTESGLTFSAMNAAMSAGVIWPEARALCAATMSSLGDGNSSAMSSGSRKLRWDPNCSSRMGA